MAQNSTRIWETTNEPSSVTTRHSHPAQLPSIATLTNELPPGGAVGPTSPQYSTPNRSSDPFSQPQSTRSSAYSSGLNNIAYSSGVTSPHRASNSSQLGSTSHPYDHNPLPTSAGSQASPGFASPHNSLSLRSPHDSIGLPNLNQQYHQQEQNQYRHSDSFPPQESRRSSIGSSVNTGLSNMHLNGAVTSPYANSNNQSHSSIAASLQRERGIPQPSGVRNSGLSATSSHMSQQPMSPLNPYPGESRQAFSSRIAPSIGDNPIKEVYNAEKPTAGQPYAFPDPDMSGGSSNNSMHERNGSTMLSRRNSDHTSITSSIITNDSKLPKGQHRLDEDPMPGTHHHSLNHNKHVSGSLAGESDSPDAASPYSRTPALRASHKMAERKRRTEMKYLFEQLRNQIPASHGSKSSKWEILSKASEHINLLEKSLQQSKEAQQQLANASAQMDAVRQEMETLRNENHHLYQEMQHYREQARPATATAMHPQPAYVPPPPTGAPMMIDQNRSLPPLTTGLVAGANSMQGVQYSEDRR